MEILPVTATAVPSVFWRVVRKQQTPGMRPEWPMGALVVKTLPVSEQVLLASFTLHIFVTLQETKSARCIEWVNLPESDLKILE